MAKGKKPLSRLHSFERKVLHALLPFAGKREAPPTSVLVAVSGGTDSSAFLHALFELVTTQRLRYSISVAHFNHKYRPESDDEASFVRQWCERQGIVYQEGIATEPLPSSNLETWFRGQRYRFLEQARNQVGADWVLTAHTRSDLIETTLMQVFSNREIRPPRRVDERRRLLRPLLEIERKEILDYLSSRSIPFCTDQSNYDRRFLRTQVRHDVLPLLEQQFGVSVRESISELARSCEADNHALYSYGAPSQDKVSLFNFGERSWIDALRHELQTLPPSVAWRLVEQIFLCPLGFPLGRKHSLRLTQFLMANSASIELPGFHLLQRKGGKIVLTSRAPLM
jgi:tRNA(Ile)-lysidine synthase